jgi:hypothetical protein
MKMLNMKMLMFVTLFALLAALPPVLACYQELRVYVAFCGGTRPFWTSKTVTYIEVPESVEILIPKNIYQEIVKYFGTNTFLAPMHETKFSQSKWGRRSMTTGHELAIGVIGVPSITVILRSL